MDLQLNGMRAFVTGASRGLGYTTALFLVQEGCHVALNSRSAENLAKALESINRDTGVQAISIPGDVADPAIPDQVIHQAVEALGGLDLLVTNSGGPPSGKFETLDDETWQKAIELTFLSHVRLIRSALPFLRQSAAPSVLTITSISVKQPLPNLVLSNAIRSATVNLTKSLALELGPDGIRFNSILPAWTKTERVTELMAYRAKVNGTTIEAEIAKQSMESPFGRMAKPEEIARPAVFLLSPAASYITGVMLTVDGGMYKSLL
jgi:3-oxoacyl-[acyl-carrier protein] reductase